MKKIKALLVIFCCAVMSSAYSQQGHEVEQDVLRQWKAGVSVSVEAVAYYGVDNCFAAYEIDDELFKRIKGLSYKDNCTIELSELRYLRVLHYNANSQLTMGELICNKSISDDLLSIFKQLYEAKYLIDKMLLVDEYGADDTLSMINNNTSCFNFRFIAGTTKLSNHSRGLAIDINPLYNPYVKKTADKLIVEPVGAEQYADRKRAFKYKIDTTDLCYKLFTSHGFEWGGSWTSSQDYQHFEKK